MYVFFKVQVLYKHVPTAASRKLQEVQLEEPGSEYSPYSQGVQSEEPAAEKVPDYAKTETTMLRRKICKKSRPK